MTAVAHKGPDVAASTGCAEHRAVIQAIEPAVERELRVLAPVARAWQSSDYLPDFERDDWVDRVSALRTAAAALPDDLLVVLVGDMVTEEALPSYSLALNQLVQDHEGTSPAPWARWLRGWSAEENRHGDLLNAYLRLTGRVDMRGVEESVHTLIANGFAPETGTDPYHLLVYTAFQERATRLSHGQVGRRADEAGEPHLARICRVIAGDEARHERFYTRMMAEVLAHDPAGGVMAFATMLKRQVAMPGRRMADGRDPDLFDRFAAVAQRTGVYTATDYASIVAHLVQTWNIARLSVTGEAARDQDALCRAPARLARVADRVAAAVRRRPPSAFRWIRGRVA